MSRPAKSAWPLGSLAVTQAEYETAREIVRGGRNADAAERERAYQILLYCRGGIFYRELAVEWLAKHRRS